MQESKGREATLQRDDSEEQVRDRETDATTDQTLTDLEKKKQIGDSEKTSQRDVPAPDAEPEQPRRERADEVI